MTVESGARALLLEAETRLNCAGDDLHAEVEQDIAELRHLDFQAIDEVVAIEPWGRSGSILLASYLDGHDKLMTLPALRSNGIYIFFESHPTLSLREKLIAYPLFNESHDAQSHAAGCGRSFFEGPFAVDRRRYLAAASAVAGLYDSLPPAFSTSGRGFFIAVHAAFDRARGRRMSTPAPMIVCAQHERDNPNARHLVEDFSKVSFVHTVRDPISSVDRLFDWFFDSNLLSSRQATAAERADRAASSGRYVSVLAAWMTLRLILAADRPHGIEQGRTRIVRFEDLHQRTADTMRDLASWLGIEFTPLLTESTFAGRPYVVTRDGKSWSGARREKLKRDTRNLSRVDRGLIYSLFYENCRAWGYPCPRAFDHRLLRIAVTLLASLWPMRMEKIVAKAAWHRRIWPWIKQGQWRVPADTLARLVFARAAIWYLAVREIADRSFRRRHVIELTGAKSAPFEK